MIETVSYTSALAERLRERIKREGPITFCDWMKAALYDETDGYYCRPDRKKWGREGDYRTSPERSSLFAATFARYFARLYDQLGRPREWTIVEVGAGDGSFARGVLQTLLNFFPHIFSATHYIIDEPGPHSQSLAREQLKAFADSVEFGAIESVRVDSGIVFSNELLDAFPVHRVTLQDGQLREFYVNTDTNGGFKWAVRSPSTKRLIDYFQDGGLQLSEGQIAEVNLEIEEWLGRVSGKLNRGYLVTVDYGMNAEELYNSSARYSGTLRGFRRHQLVEDVLALPGEQDLTTTVNWTFVKRVGEKLGLDVAEFNRQDKFLLAAGLLEQLDAESQCCKSEADKLRLTTAAREMILPDGMAASFQVLVQKKTS